MGVLMTDKEDLEAFDDMRCPASLRGAHEPLEVSLMKKLEKILTEEKFNDYIKTSFAGMFPEAKSGIIKYHKSIIKVGDIPEMLESNDKFFNILFSETPTDKPLSVELPAIDFTGAGYDW